MGINRERFRVFKGKSWGFLMGYRCFIDFIEENVRLYNHYQGYPIHPIDQTGILFKLSKFYIWYYTQNTNPDGVIELKISDSFIQWAENNDLTLKLYFPNEQQWDIQWHYIVIHGNDGLYVSCYNPGSKQLLFNACIGHLGNINFLSTKKCIIQHRHDDDIFDSTILEKLGILKLKNNDDIC